MKQQQTDDREACRIAFPLRRCCVDSAILFVMASPLVGYYDVVNHHGFFGRDFPGDAERVRNCWRTIGATRSDLSSIGLRLPAYDINGAVLVVEPSGDVRVVATYTTFSRSILRKLISDETSTARTVT